MKVYLYQKVIERCPDPTDNLQYKRATKITKNKIGITFMEFIPRKGDIIFFKDVHYDVMEVIFEEKKKTKPSLTEWFVVLEVQKHSNTVTTCAGAYSFEEEIPPVTAIDD